MEKQKWSNKKKLIVGVSVLLVVVLAFAAVYLLTKPKAQQGAKTITVQVVVSDTDTKDFTIHTDEEYLRGALEAENLIEGDESEFGLFVTSVNGVKVDDSKNEWWNFKKDGQDLMTGVDTTPVADGDSFEIVLSTY